MRGVDSRSKDSVERENPVNEVPGFSLYTGEVPTREELAELYTSVGWSAYTDKPEELVPMVQGSLYACVAREDATGRLAGLVRAVGDGVSISYIQDLLVDPVYQGKGLGAALLAHALDAVGGVRQVYITTDSHESNSAVIEMYQRRGFRAISDYNCITLAKLH